MNKIFIITGPAGAGEDSVIEGLKKYFSITRAVTTTTREIRPEEKNGVDYYFVSKDEFKNMVANDEFFEWVEEDRGKLYGGTHQEIKRLTESDKVAIWKIEFQGAIEAKKLLPNIVIIYLYIPPEIVEKRLRKRGQVDENFIKARLDFAKGWYENEDKFDYKIENKEGELDRTITQVKKIIEKELKK